MNTFKITILANTMINRVLAGLLALCLAQSALADLPDGIEVSLKSTQIEFGVKEEILLEVGYTNVTDEKIKLLTWGTALEGRINEDFLSITFDGDELPYMGMHIKRAPATQDDYVTIAPNETLSRKVDILSGYDIDDQGNYEVLLRDLSRARQQKAKPVTFKLLANRLVSFKRTPTVNGCPDGVANLPNNRFALTDQAVGLAEGIARKARDDLSNTPVDQRPNAQRYRKWFGSYDASRWNTVQTRFNKIYDAVRNQTLVFECEDDESYFAAVFPSQPYKIFLGRAFWNARATGTDSKAGTIVHELSHFNVLGVNGSGTDDFAYGQGAASNLANSSPNQAVGNADSLEYFAENTPFLAMPEPGAPPSEPDPAPDLAVTFISTASDVARVRDTVEVSGRVRNVGDLVSPTAQITFRLSSDASITPADTLLEQVALPALAAGASSTFAAEVALPDEEGEYWLGVCVSSVSGELETTNNCSAAVPILVERPFVIPPILFLLLGDDSVIQ